MSKWQYMGKPLVEIPEGYFGMVYRITCKCCGFSDKFYVGSKQFGSVRTKKLSKKGQEAAWSGKGRKPTKTKVESESNWKTYNSSSKDLQALIKDLGESCFTYEVLELATSKSYLSYLETKWIFDTNALLEDSFNAWVSCRVRRNNLK